MAAGLAETAKLMASLSLDTSKFDRGVAKATGGIDKLSSNVKRGASSAGKNIERGIVVGAVAAGGALTYAVTKAIDWESAIAGINKTIEATPDELKEIEKGLIAISNRAPTSAVDLAQIAETAGALGIAKKDILSFTETVALIGSTTNVSTDDAATALGQLSNVLNLTGVDYDNFAAALVDLGNKGSSTEAQILEVTRRAGSAAKLIGIAKDETLGWAAAAANLGLNEELAGTSLQSFFIKAMPAFLKGSKTLRDVTGKTAKELKTAFQKDASGALESFVKDLRNLPKDARLEAVQKLFGKGSGLTRLVLGLAESVDKNLTPSLNTGEQAWKDNTAAAAEAAKRYATTEAQLKILGQNVDNAAVVIGTTLLPLVNELATEAVSWLSTHQDDVKAFGEDLADGLRDAVGWIKSLDFKAIGGALQIAAGAAKTIVSAFTSMPSWVQAAVLTGWGLNKLTGGAFGSIVGDLASGLIKGVLGINAGIVNVNGPVAGGVPAGAGAAAGAAKGGLGVASRVFLIGEAIGLALLVNDIRTGIETASTEQAQAVAAASAAQIAHNPSKGELTTALAGVEQGIRQLESDPIGTALIAGPALTELKGIRTNILKALSLRNAPVNSSGSPDDRNTVNRSGSPADRDTAKRLDEVKAQAQRTAAAVKDADSSIDATKVSLAAAAGKTTQAAQYAGATAAGASRAAGNQVAAAVWGARPIVNTYVNVSATSVIEKKVVISRYGSTSGDRNSSGSPDDRNG